MVFLVARMSAAKSGAGRRLIPDFAALNPGYQSAASPLRAGELLRIRRRLVLAGRHQLAVGAEEVVLALDLDPRVLLRAHRGAPERVRLVGPLGRLLDRPRPRQRVVVDGDVVVENV